MGTQIMWRATYLPVVSRNVLKMLRSLKARAARRRFNIAMAGLVAEGSYEETRHLLRKRFTLTAMQDMDEVGRIADELIDADPLMLSLITPIAKAFAEGAARDIRNFGSR